MTDLNENEMTDLKENEKTTEMLNQSESDCYHRSVLTLVLFLISLYLSDKKRIEFDFCRFKY